MGLCEDYSPDKLGGIGSGIITEAGKQPHDHAAVAVDRALRDSAMISQPTLELGNTLIDDRDLRRGCPYHAALDQEANEPAHAAHVFGREATMLTVTATFAPVSRKPRDHDVIDVNDGDIRIEQPLSKVTGSVPVTCRCQSCVPKAC